MTFDPPAIIVVMALHLNSTTYIKCITRESLIWFGQPNTREKYKFTEFNYARQQRKLFWHFLQSLSNIDFPLILPTHQTTMWFIQDHKHTRRRCCVYLFSILCLDLEWLWTIFKFPQLRRSLDYQEIAPQLQFAHAKSKCASLTMCKLINFLDFSRVIVLAFTFVKCCIICEKHSSSTEKCKKMWKECQLILFLSTFCLCILRLCQISIVRSLQIAFKLLTIVIEKSFLAFFFFPLNWKTEKSKARALFPIPLELNKTDDILGRQSM